MDRLLESLATTQKRLRDAGIDSVAIGGIAVAAWGEVRVTRDVDVRVILDREQAPLLLNALGNDYKHPHLYSLDGVRAAANGTL